MKNTQVGRSWKVRLAATASAMSIAFAGFIGVGSAMAAPVQTQPTSPEALTTPTSLTIHKIAGSESSLPHDGTEQDIDDILDASGGTALENVEFSVTPVTGTTAAHSAGALPFTLTTAAGWQNLITAGVENDVAGVVAGTTYALGSPLSDTTDPDGSVVFANLPIGLYLVQETDDGGNNTVSPAAPFLVTIPLNVADENGDATDNWLYDVHVYPKNTIPEIPVKEVGDPSSNLQGEVPWTVTQAIPTLGSTDTFTSFSITDDLDDRLNYIADSAEISVGGTVWTSGFTIANPDPNAGNVLAVAFDATGLANLMAAQGSDIVLTFRTEVDEAGIYENTAVTNINDSEYTTNEVNTYWGGITIEKRDASNTDTKLDGVSFALYDTPAAPTDADTPLTTGTTGAGGLLDFGPLWVSNTEANGSKVYWIVETAAKEGYVLNPTPRSVTVTANEAGTYVAVEVDNPPVIIPGLPLTGAQGTAIIIGLGALLLVAAGGMIFIRHRRTH